MSTRGRETAAQRQRTDETGGAVSLMVMLMVPVCVLAAITAAAVPKRLAAHSAADAAASNLATLAIAWRDAQGRDHDAVGWFFDDCAPYGGAAAEAAPGSTGDDLRHACETLTGSLLAGLSVRGFDSDTLTGFYSSAYTTASPAIDGDVHPASVPCHAGGGTVVADAAYLALAAEWATGDWAAAQVWPGGTTISAEAVGRITRPGVTATAVNECGELLDITALAARPRLAERARSAAVSLPTHTVFGNR